MAANHWSTVVLFAAALVACGPAEPDKRPVSVPAERAPAVEARWELLSSGEGAGLRLSDPIIHFFCPALSGELLVNVPSFKAVASGERLSLGSGGTVVALVADSRGDPLRGGVSAAGPVPREFAAMLSGAVSVNYGAQSAGPFPAIPDGDRAAFLTACREPPPEPETAKTSACRMQDGKPLPAMTLRAVGTEPFWRARIDGRCVTYSTIDDQQGQRVWTRYSESDDRKTWSGALEGRPFELLVTATAGCSDGMSDKSYPMSVVLRAHGETRIGCAE